MVISTRGRIREGLLLLLLLLLLETMRRPSRKSAVAENAEPRVCMKLWMMSGISLWNRRLPRIPSTVIMMIGFWKMAWVTLITILVLDMSEATSRILPTSIRMNPMGLRNARETGARRYRYIGYSGCLAP